MNPSILDFLKTQRTCVLAVEMKDGSPHGATVHFAHSDNPFLLYFETNKQYRKVEPLVTNGQTRATVVIGTSEDMMKTLQMDGILRLLPDNEIDTYNAVYLEKFPEKTEKSKNPDFVRMVFTPTWWRFTDFKGPSGKVIITSEDR